jgi:hypothetical protein
MNEETIPQGSVTRHVQKPASAIGWLGICCIIFGCLMSGLKALIWSKGFITAEVIGYAAGAVLLPGVIAYAIAGRVKQRNWNKFGFWFTALCFFFLLLEISSKR